MIATFRMDGWRTIGCSTFLRTDRQWLSEQQLCQAIHVYNIDDIQSSYLTSTTFYRSVSLPIFDSLRMASDAVRVSQFDGKKPIHLAVPAYDAIIFR